MSVHKRVYVDTNALPTKGGIGGGLFGVLAATARAMNIQIMVPRLVLSEYRNLRAGDIRSSLEIYTKGFESLQAVLELDSIYLPSVEEAIHHLIADLLARVTPIETFPDDAIEALRREAERIPPARDGKGARDSAIWLTICRHHLAAEGCSAFITKNKSDFSARSDPKALHPKLAEDLGAPLHDFTISPIATAFLTSGHPP
jgi:PIN domain